MAAWNDVHHLNGNKKFFMVFSVTHDYGIEDSGVCFSTTFEQLSLDVPRVDIQFTPTQLIQLQNLFSPLLPSDNGGVDIYVNVRQLMYLCISQCFSVCTLHIFSQDSYEELMYR